MVREAGRFAETLPTREKAGLGDKMGGQILKLLWGGICKTGLESDDQGTGGILQNRARIRRFLVLFSRPVFGALF